MKIVQLKFRGKFGNQLLSYACARALAEEYGAELQTEPWVGETLFEGVKPNPIKEEPSLLIWGLGNGFDSGTKVTVGDLRSREVIRFDHWMGFVRHHTFQYTFTKKQLQSWFEFKPKYKIPSFYPFVYHLKTTTPEANSWNGLYYTNISLESYQEAIKETFPKQFRYFEPISGYAPHWHDGIQDDLQYIVDFQIMTQADILFRSNSSFSWMAASLADYKQQIFSPIVRGVKTGLEPQFCEFKPGNSGSFWPAGLINAPEIS